jgi:hypothetical protein
MRTATTQNEPGHADARHIVREHGAGSTNPTKCQWTRARILVCRRLHILLILHSAPRTSPVHLRAGRRRCQCSGLRMGPR